MEKIYKMSRQIQIRRGTATEHANFTGAIGEITVDTTNKTLRVHDGQTPGGITLARTDELVASSPIPDTADYVVETQLPTALNNYTWYRKYASGWIEQGGCATSSDTSTPRMVILPVVMKDTNYTLTLGLHRENTTSAGAICVYEAINSRTSNSFGTIGQWNNTTSAGRTAYKYNWMVIGLTI